VIALAGVAARRAPLALASLTLSWDAGVHAVVGTHDDGGPLLLALVAGAARLRAGTVRVLDGSPGDATVRRRIGWVPLEPVLPEALRVREVLELASSVRGEAATDATARLAQLGVESLAPRLVRSLAAEEARAVAMAEALTSNHVRVVLLEEPLVGVDPRAAARLPEALRARARAGCAVLLATASLRDAGELADDHVLLRGGAVVGRVGSIAELSAAGPDGVRIRVVARDPESLPALQAAVASESAVEAVARRDGVVVARGRDAMALAAAVGRAIVLSGVDVVEMRIEPPTFPPAFPQARGAP
jgi:ABC-2 type transport system ATP-binding protein